MFLKAHAILTLLLCIPLYFIFQEKVIIIFLAGFLIDIDHYIEYIFSHKSFSIKKAYKYYIQKAKIAMGFFKKGKKFHHKNYIHIFHTVEILIITLIFSFYYLTFKLIFIGIFFHQILDTIQFINLKRKYHSVKYERPISIIYYLYQTLISK